MTFLDKLPEFSLLKWTGFQIAFTQVIVASRVQIVCRSHIKACKTCRPWKVLPPYIGLHEVYTPTCRAWKTWTNVLPLLHRGGRRLESYSVNIGTPQDEVSDSRMHALSTAVDDGVACSGHPTVTGMVYVDLK